MAPHGYEENKKAAPYGILPVRGCFRNVLTVVFPVTNDDAAVFLAADEAGGNGTDLVPPVVVILIENKAAAGDAFGKGLLHDGTQR